MLLDVEGWVTDEDKYIEVINLVGSIEVENV